MSATAAILGIPVPFDFDGNTFKVQPRTLEMEGKYAVWLESRSIAFVQRNAPSQVKPGELVPGRLSPGEYMAQLEGVRRDAVVGTYDFDSVYATQSRFSEAGARYLAFLQLEANGVDQTFVDDLFEDPQGRLAFELAQSNAGLDPNRRRATRKPAAIAPA